MKRVMIVMMMLTVLSVSCKKSGGSSSEESTETTTTTATGDTSGDDSGTTVPDDDTGGSDENDDDAPPATSTVPAAAKTFGTNVKLYDFTTAQTTKYNEAIKIVKKVVATEEFRTRVLNHTYNGSKTFVQNNGLTNAQIYQTILDAAEKLTPTKNNTMDLGVKLYYENNNVVGWTNTSITYINVNTKFFNSYAFNSVASNLFHEWLHKVGYGHDSAATARRPYSVPYAIGYIIRDIGADFL